MRGDTPSPGPRPIRVLGIGADGWAGLPEHHRRRVQEADTVIGGRRHLDLLPDVPGQHRSVWPSPLRAHLPRFLDALGQGTVVALASGDPLLSGVGSTLVDVLGPDRVVVEPAVSSVALARARLHWSAEGCVVVSLVGRDPRLLLREVAPGRRILALSSDGGTPGEVSALLREAGYGASRVTVLGDLGTRQESRLEGSASTWAGEAPRLNVLAVECVGPPSLGWVAGLPDDVFEHDGQLTRRDLRASALARLAPAPGEHLWDVGAGAGSVGIEWMRAHPTCTATAVEADAERSARIGRNAARLGVPGLEVVRGRAPEALTGLGTPQAVFVGGGATRAGVITDCLAALPPDGRIVVHGVTLETEHLLGRLHCEHGGELTRISVETAQPVGRFTGWTPARTVTQWAYAP